MAPLQQDLGVFDHSERMPKLSTVNCQFGEAAKHQFICQPSARSAARMGVSMGFPNRSTNRGHLTRKA